MLFLLFIIYMVVIWMAYQLLSRWVNHTWCAWQKLLLIYYNYFSCSLLPNIMNFIRISSLLSISPNCSNIDAQAKLISDFQLYVIGPLLRYFCIGQPRSYEWYQNNSICPHSYIKHQIVNTLCCSLSKLYITTWIIKVMNWILPSCDIFHRAKLNWFTTNRPVIDPTQNSGDKVGLFMRRK
jgi:hypothetical protein